MLNSTLILKDIGVFPAHPFSLYFALAALSLWILFIPFAYLRHIHIFYISSLRAAFGEEFIFRGILYGIFVLIWHNELYALIISSLLFGLVHMRNLWWAGWRRSWNMTVYAGFTGGPIFGVIRLLSGDIYLGILVHFVHNFLIMFPPPGMGKYMAHVPRDEELRARR